MVGPQVVWQLAEPDTNMCDELAAGLGLSPVVARILYNRGIRTVEEAQRFLVCDFSELHDPFLLKDMELAVNRILTALESGEKVVVYGDYDVDGVTSTALLLDALSYVGCAADFYIPDRLEEGYGINREALDKLAVRGIKLVITVDCGISAREEAEYAKSLGLDLIVTDHHEPPEALPGALAVINPKRRDCLYPFKDLAGVGVAFKLAQALFSRCRKLTPEGTAQNLLDLVTLGSIADMVPLMGENRVLVKHGLPRLTQPNRVGIVSLMEVAGLTGRVIGAGQVGFALAPRINATGRIGDAAIAVRLLRTEDLMRAREMAVYLDSENKARQEIESAVLAQALEMLGEFNAETDKFIVLARENWHPGVIGIVASRLVEKFYRPVILISLDGEAGKGSGRSIPGFNLYEALRACSDLLLRYGGHKQAAGLAIQAQSIESLRLELNRLAGLAPEEVFCPKLRIDVTVGLDEVDAGLVQGIKGLEPFGIGNPNPVLVTTALTLLETREVGRDKAHLKIKVKGGNKGIEGIGFNLARKNSGLASCGLVDVAFTPDFNEYNGRISVQLQLKDIKSSGNSVLNDKEEQDFRKLLSAGELAALECLARGQSTRLVADNHLFPVLAAIKIARQTGQSSVLVYPLPAIAAWVATAGEILTARYNLKIYHIERTEDFLRLPGGSKVIVASGEFLAQDVARLEKISLELGLLGVDSLTCSADELEKLGVPVLYTETAGAVVKAHAPSRERLARLYKVIEDLALRQGNLGSDPCAGIAELLEESPEFVRVGLEIFEELHIIKRKKSKTKRIIYFQAPDTKLNLSDSPRYREGRALAEELAKLQ